MSKKTLYESAEELEAAMQALRAAIWESRWQWAPWLVLLWLTFGLLAFAYNA